MTITGEYAVAAVLPSAWKSIMSQAMVMHTVREYFMGVVRAPIAFIGGSYEMDSRLTFKFSAIPAIQVRELALVVNLSMV